MTKINFEGELPGNDSYFRIKKLPELNQCLPKPVEEDALPGLTFSKQLEAITRQMEWERDLREAQLAALLSPRATEQAVRQPIQSIIFGDAQSTQRMIGRLFTRLTSDSFPLIKLPEYLNRNKFPKNEKYENIIFINKRIEPETGE